MRIYSIRICRIFLGGELFMKKTVSTILVACMMMLFMAPSLAENDAFQPYGALVLEGGMKYVISEGKHCIYAQCTGKVEWKRITVTLYKQNGSDWEYIDSATNTGTTNTVSISKYVNIGSGYYKVVVTGTTSTHNGSTPYYYSI